MATAPPIPTTPLAVEVRPNHWRKLSAKDFSRGLEPDPHDRYRVGGWSAVDDRGETELTIVRDTTGYSWELTRLEDQKVLYRLWMRD
jgi:hypothetical protein